MLYADIEVTLLTESIDYEEFTVRELRLTNLAEPGQPHRTIQHLHYQVGLGKKSFFPFVKPNRNFSYLSSRHGRILVCQASAIHPFIEKCQFDVFFPNSAHPGGIVHFARLFRNKLPPSAGNKPTIVHCSAGVGRSGTFIALDRLVQHIECGRPIDVFGTVYEMRMERCHMVQNEVRRLRKKMLNANFAIYLQCAYECCCCFFAAAIHFHPSMPAICARKFLPILVVSILTSTAAIWWRRWRERDDGGTIEQSTPFALRLVHFLTDRRCRHWQQQLQQQFHDDQ